MEASGTASLAWMYEWLFFPLLFHRSYARDLIQLAQKHMEPFPFITW